MNLGEIKRNYASTSDQALMTLYLGRHADKYLWAQEIMPSLPRKIFWNWAAALLGPVWLFYRKLYGWFFIWLLLGVSVDFLYFATPRLEKNFSGSLLNLLGKYYVSLSIAYLLLTGLILGCWGTYLYLRQSEEIVALYKSKTPSSIAAALLEKHGNPGIWRVFIGGVIILSFYVLTVWLARSWVNGNFLI